MGERKKSAIKTQKRWRGKIVGKLLQEGGVVIKALSWRGRGGASEQSDMYCAN